MMTLAWTAVVVRSMVWVPSVSWTPCQVALATVHTAASIQWFEYWLVVRVAEPNVLWSVRDVGGLTGWPDGPVKESVSGRSFSYTAVTVTFCIIRGSAELLATVLHWIVLRFHCLNRYRAPDVPVMLVLVTWTQFMVPFA